MPDSFSIVHVPMEHLPASGGGVLDGLSSLGNVPGFGSSGGSVREACITTGLPLWVRAVVSVDGRGFDNGESIQVSGTGVAGQVRSLWKVVGVSAAVAAVFFSGFLIYLSGV